MPAQTIIARDPRTGRITGMPEGAAVVLQSGRRRSWGGPDRRKCQRCGTIAMRDSEFCWRHDAGYLRDRTVIALQSGDASRVMNALARLHRTTMKTVWTRDPWQAGLTIWFAPSIERAFIFAAIQAGLTIQELPVWTTDRLRWGFRLSRIDRTDLAAWGRYVQAARRHAADQPPAPAGYAWQGPPAAAPGSPVATVEAAPHLGHRRRLAPLQPRQKGRDWAAHAQPAQTLPTVPRRFDVEAFITAHMRDLREPMKALGQAVDDPLVRRDLARCWAAVLAGDSLNGYRGLARLMQTRQPLALTAVGRSRRG